MTFLSIVIIVYECIMNNNNAMKQIRLVKQDLPFMNPCWLGLIPWLSFTCPVSALRMNRSIILPSTKVRLTGL